MGRSPGRFAKTTQKRSNAPVSREHFGYKSPTKPVGSPGVARGSTPVLATDTHISVTIFKEMSYGYIL